MRITLLFLILVSISRADPLLDLRKTLEGLQGKGATRAKVSFDYWNRTGDDKSPNVEQAKINLVAQDGPDGLNVLWSPDLINSVASEMQARTRDPEKGIPTRKAMDELSAIRVNDYFNAAAGFLLKLESAQLIEDKADVWHNQPARLLTLKLTPTLSQHDKKYVKELEVTAKVWVDTNGFPLAAESHSHLKGRALLVITFESEESETFTFFHTASRLLIVQHSKESRSSGAGENGQQRTTTRFDVLSFS